MAILTDTRIIEIMRNIYNKRLHEAVNEIDLFDDRGNMIIGRDLKVRHKKSGLEYTVSDVLRDYETGEIMVKLRKPSVPRFSKQDTHNPKLHDGDRDLLGEDDMYAGEYGISDTGLGKPEGADSDADVHDDIDVGDDVVFFMSQDEFEKEYEVD